MEPVDDHNLNALQTYCDEMERELESLLRERGFLLGGVLPSSEDIETMWDKLSADFLADAVREFQSYPVVTLAWASYLGMGVAWQWDSNWNLCCQSSYAYYQGREGFDDMDEHITQDLLGLSLDDPQAVSLADMLRSLSEMALKFILNAPVERGSAQAYHMFLRSVHIMYRLGAAVELKRLGYKMEAVEN